MCLFAVQGVSSFSGCAAVRALFVGWSEPCITAKSGRLRSVAVLRTRAPHPGQLESTLNTARLLIAATFVLSRYG